MNDERLPKQALKYKASGRPKERWFIQIHISDDDDDDDDKNRDTAILPSSPNRCWMKCAPM